MPALPGLPRKIGTNGLRNWFDNILKPEVDEIPAIRDALQVRMDLWEEKIEPLLEKYQDSGTIIINQNDNPAFIQSRRKSVKDLNDAMKKYQDSIDRGDIETGDSGALNELSNIAAVVQQNSRDWDTNNANFQKETEAREKIFAENEEYKNLLTELFTELKFFREYYNRKYYLHVNMDAEIRDTFFTSVEHAIQWRPTRHWWNSAAYKKSEGIYFYDFASNKFQMHVHQRNWEGKIVSVQVKLYSEKKGVTSHYRTMAEAIAQRFMLDYPPSQHGMTTVT